ncbi:MAG: hydroxymethylpyrimidine/phosphomethylpyrimidine kinase, partial [Burkholderiaceae bacterium]
QALDAGFRPGMGNVIPDRFFWAVPGGDDDDDGAAASDEDDDKAPKGPRHVH